MGRQITTYAQTIEYLYNIRLHGTKLGLDSMHALSGFLGHPEAQLKFIHIAGTNGKGSVAAMMESVLRHAGYKTGMYTSPHLISFCERFRVNNQTISETRIVQLVEKLKKGMHTVEKESGRAPTFFEFITGMALEHFAVEKVDFVIWETGLGGRLDATNIVKPIVSVITTIGYDHMQYLGDTLAAIAGEKAGIIKSGVPVVTGVRDEEALEVIESVADGKGAKVIHAWKNQTWTGKLQCGLGGLYQRNNMEVAVSALGVMEASGIAISEKGYREGFKNVQWPGRFQVLRRDPLLVLDGAHNEPAAQALAATLRLEYSGSFQVLILGMLEDKDIFKVCAVLAPQFREIILVPVKSQRGASPLNMVDVVRRTVPGMPIRVTMSVEESLDLVKNTPALIAGSLYLAGEVLAIMQKAGAYFEPDLQDNVSSEGLPASKKESGKDF
ncbi:MAG: folylpolyglutamate synthase/dihydrofolate synthase family protein [Verrucomicrobiota bacterium]|nr:folylpolyglutamate synthase/dihydrofolate synthase family protein [Verrucomicrobiota bacterium]